MTDQIIDTPPAQSSPSWALRVGLLVGASLFALVLCELGLRATGFKFLLYPEGVKFGYPDPEVLNDYFKPHERLLWVKPDYAERLQAARAQRPHLLLTGCSCTDWGEFGKVVAAQVERTPGAAPLHYSNLACAGWSSFQGLQQMKTDVVAIGPKVVTIYFGWNDHWLGFGVDDAAAARLTSSPLLLKLQQLRLAQLVSKYMVDHQADDAGRVGAQSRPMRVSLDDFRSNIEAMVAIAREHDIIPVLMTAPTTHTVGKEPTYLTERWIEDLSDLVPLHQRYVSVVREIAEAQDVVLCDLATTFEQLPQERRAQFMRVDGIHFTPPGATFVGRELFRCLNENQLLPAAEEG